MIPYTLCVTRGGTAQLSVDGIDGSRTSVETEVPLRRWTRVTASLDAETGEMRLWSGDRLMATRLTGRRLFTALDAGAAPGVGIGNVQNDRGPHNQPLDGILVDLRLYGAALAPVEAGYRSGIDAGRPE